MKAIKIKSGHVIKCPVHEYHIIPADRWTFNGDLDRPTFAPSVREYKPPVNSGAERVTSCHFNVTNGKLILHSDSNHEMAGQTLDLADFTEQEVANWNQPGYQE